MRTTTVGNRELDDFIGEAIRRWPVSVDNSFADASETRSVIRRSGVTGRVRVPYALFPFQDSKRVGMCISVDISFRSAQFTTYRGDPQPRYPTLILAERYGTRALDMNAKPLRSLHLIKSLVPGQK
jgi:hypothetical protein